MKNTTIKPYGRTLKRFKTERLIVQSLQEIMKDINIGKKEEQH